MRRTSFTTAFGMGPLPRLLENAQGTRALERVFRAEGLPLWLIHNQSSKLPLRCMMGLFERSAREMGDDLFGLNLGLAMQPEDYGPVGRYIASAPTLVSMIRRSARAVPYHCSGSEFGLKVENAMVYWTFRVLDPISTGRRHLIDHVIPSVMQVLRQCVGTNWTPLRLELEYDRPSGWRTLEAWIGAPVAFGARTNAVVFGADLLARPSARRIPPKDLLTWSDLRRFIALRPPRTSVEAACEVVRLRLLDATVDVEGAARLLGVGSRTLQRQLAQENFTYRGLVLQLRMQRASDLLRESSEPVTSIAFALGYSDVTSFSRAFREWAGVPPSHYRQSPRAESS